MYKLEISQNYKSFKNFILNIKDDFNSTYENIHNARNELKIISYEGIDTVVKSFKVPNLINKIAYSFFRDSKAKKAYEYALKISRFTPQPIGYIEFYKFGLLHESYFISEKFEYDFTIREPLLDDKFKRKKQILKDFAHFTYELHQEGIYHNDYSPGNILIKKTKENFIFKIVDINRMKFFNLDIETRALNFSKLWASDEELQIIGLEYAKLASFDPRLFVEKMQYYSNKNKTIKNFKKRLKGKKIDN
ncbi:MAG: hypothetical protein IE909_09025 [Campylobacterales bacterium]|nr:hypothetical protein [Campylobacterales bacterium]